MSKKKAFSGSTMTLKDFHGGSIPSDIPLPSAPGVIVRPTDRPSFDRQGSWGNPMGRPDHRLRPSSSGSMRNLDDKSPFLTNTAHIGRNFDEEERKPLDGVSSPRRTVSDEAIGAPLMRMEPRSDVGRFMGHQGSAPLSQTYNSSDGPYSARVPEAVHTGSTSWTSAAGHGVSGGPHSNAWAVRKEVIGAVETTPSPYVAQSSISKFAQASALDKVSSGRWQTKPVHHQADVEAIRQAEAPNSLHPRENDAYHGITSMNESEYGEKMLVRHAERGLALEDNIQIVAKELPAVERIRSPAFLDAKERASGFLAGSGQPHAAGIYGNSGSQLHSEASQRPKLKLLPRTKPLEATELPFAEYNQKFRQPNDSGHIESSQEAIVNDSHVKPGLSAGVEEGKQLSERPKLNLKPRTQPLNQTDDNAERARLAVFGGARPRELVLKERGADDDVVNSQEVVQSSVRVKKDSPGADTMLVHSNATHRSEKPANASLDHRFGKSTERREQRADHEKTEPQRKSWRNENWRNSRDSEKQQHQAQYQQERPASPETWRKPVEQPKPENTEGSGLRFGKKAVSAVELAQAFSKSVSDPKQNSAGQFSNPKGVPGRTQAPFSRLTGSTSRPQINGY